MITSLVLDECRERVERARRRLPRVWSDWGRRSARMDHGDYPHLARLHDRLFVTGQVTWAALVMANDGLFYPGGRDLPAAVVYSLDRTFDRDARPLSAIAHALFSLKDTRPRDPMLAALAAEVSDETAREINLILPPPFTGGHAVRYEGIYIQRHRLPTGRLVDALLPVIVDPRHPTQVMLLPLSCWAQTLVDRWHELDRNNPPPPEPEIRPATQGEFVQGGGIRLTEAALKEIHTIIRQQRLQEVKLRVSVEHGVYALDLTEEPADPRNDLVLSVQGLMILTDRRAAGQLAGVTIDIRNSPAGRGFVFLTNAEQ